MTQEKKQLILKDICARLPYGVIVQYKQKTFYPDGEYTVDVKIEVDDMLCHRLKCLDFKPYLRPKSSMTEEEREEYREILDTIICQWDDCGRFIGFTYAHPMSESIDWLNAHHFDYRGLIPMGLAIEAPEGMYGENC
jgi:hypothetical protein